MIYALLLLLALLETLDDSVDLHGGQLLNVVKRHLVAYSVVHHGLRDSTLVDVDRSFCPLGLPLLLLPPELAASLLLNCLIDEVHEIVLLGGYLG